MDKLKKYAQLQAKFEVLEEERQVLREEIVSDFKKNKTTKMKTIFGMFTIGNKSSYSFSPSVQQMEEKVKIAKHKEIVNGKATIKNITSFLVFKNNAETK